MGGLTTAINRLRDWLPTAEVVERAAEAEQQLNAVMIHLHHTRQGVAEQIAAAQSQATAVERDRSDRIIRDMTKKTRAEAAAVSEEVKDMQRQRDHHRVKRRAVEQAAQDAEKAKLKEIADLEQCVL